MGFSGFVGTVLDAVKTEVEANKVDLGLRDVFVGERRRGWNHPVCFVQLGPSGVPRSQKSGRTGVSLYEIHVRLIIVTKDATQSGEDRVVEMLEDTADQLDTQPGLGGTWNHDFPNIAQVGPFMTPEGDMETVGAQDVVYFKPLDRR